MLTKYKRKTKVTVVVGLIMQVGGWSLMDDANPESLRSLGWAFVSIVGLIVLIVGCGFYAKGKGYHGAWGALGILNIIGLVVLAFLRDRHKEVVA